MKFIIFSVGLAFLLGYSAVDAALVGGSPCTWGPNYWCGNLRQSAACSATSHCIENVWKNRELPYDDDDICTVCKNMVAQARDTLESNETQLELKEVFEGSCKLIPLEIIRKECINLADEFVPELVETLASEMNPQLVCATAGLCNSERIDAMLKQYREENPRNDCDICKSESRKLAVKFQEADKDAVLDKLLDICGNFGSYSDACKATVIHHYDVIYNVLTKDLNDEICDLVGVCVTEPYVPETTLASQNDGSDLECQFCEKVVQKWKDTWTSNTTEEEFKEVLDELCKKLDGKRAQHCLHIVDDYYIPWFNFILHELDPHMVCSTVGLCPNGLNFLQIPDDHSIFTLLNPEVSPTEEESPEIPLVPLEPALTNDEDLVIVGYMDPVERNAVEKCGICNYMLHLIELKLDGDRSMDRIIEEVNGVCNNVPAYLQPGCVYIARDKGALIAEYILNGKLIPDVCYLAKLCGNEPPAGEVCGICQYSLTLVENRIGTHRSLEQVKKEVKSMCKNIPDLALANQCQSKVAIYGDKIVDYLMQGMDISEICFKLKTCSLGSGSHVAELEEKDNKCVFCEYAVTTLEHIITDPKNEDQVKNALDQLCNYLPDSYKDQCESLVSQYTDQIIHLIINDYRPDQICQQLGFCPGGNDVRMTKMLTQESDSETCVLCEYVIQTLDSILTDKNNREEIKNALETVCGFMPDSVSNKCEEFIDNYSEMILDLLTEGMSPKELCAAMNLCPAKPAILVQEDQERPYCTLCQYAISEVDKLLQDDKNEEKIKEVLDHICYQLRAPIGKECLSMVSQYTDEIVYMFTHDYTPDQVCQELKLCQVSEVEAEAYLVHPNEIPPMDLEQPQNLGNKELCVLCDIVLEFVERQIITNRTVDMTKRALQMACAYFPIDSVAEKCEEFVDEYGDMIIKLLEEYEPKAICQSINACPQSLNAAVGIDFKCFKGPEYECDSISSVRACNASELCLIYWNKIK